MKLNKLFLFTAVFAAISVAFMVDANAAQYKKRFNHYSDGVAECAGYHNVRVYACKTADMSERCINGSGMSVAEARNFFRNLSTRSPYCGGAWFVWEEGVQEEIVNNAPPVQQSAPVDTGAFANIVGTIAQIGVSLFQSSYQQNGYDRGFQQSCDFGGRQWQPERCNTRNRDYNSPRERCFPTARCTPPPVCRPTPVCPPPRPVPQTTPPCPPGFRPPAAVPFPSVPVNSPTYGPDDNPNGGFVGPNGQQVNSTNPVPGQNTGGQMASTTTGNSQQSSAMAWKSHAMGLSGNSRGTFNNNPSNTSALTQSSQGYQGKTSGQFAMNSRQNSGLNNQTSQSFSRGIGNGSGKSMGVSPLPSNGGGKINTATLHSSGSTGTSIVQTNRSVARNFSNYAGSTSAPRFSNTAPQMQRNFAQPNFNRQGQGAFSSRGRRK